MGSWVAAVVMIALAGVAVVAMFRSWQRRVARDAAVTAAPVPVGLGEVLFDGEVLYVATTAEQHPLERLAIGGLKFRGYAGLTITPEGVVIEVAGESAVFVPSARIVGAGTATHAIDRGVERDGLTVITWRAFGEAEPTVDTYFRPIHPGDAARILDAVHQLTAGAPGVSAPTGERAVE
ncbi:MAG TPA: hypothetical protein VFU07_08505 [Candidatus Lumbricidophila sp.]|nr:hypothetical protein [Candidatus Lumbricidophila sp.]